MPISVLFLANNNQSPPISEQRVACEEDGDFDVIVEAEEESFLDLPKLLAREGRELVSGDRIKIYDLSCLPLNTMTLVRMMTKIIRQGIIIEFCASGIVLNADEENEPFRLLAGLDNHWRRQHGVKTHPSDSKPGRKPRLTAEQLVDIRQRLEESGATVNSVAKELGVGRTTLFDFLQRHKDAAN